MHGYGGRSLDIDVCIAFVALLSDLRDVRDTRHRKT